MSKVTKGSVGAERAQASGAPADSGTSSRGCFSVQKKTAAVLRMMRGESLDIVSRDLGVTAARLSAFPRRRISQDLGAPSKVCGHQRIEPVG